MQAPECVLIPFPRINICWFVFWPDRRSLNTILLTLVYALTAPAGKVNARFCNHPVTWETSCFLLFTARVAAADKEMMGALHFAQDPWSEDCAGSASRLHTQILWTNGQTAFFPNYPIDVHAPMSRTYIFFFIQLPDTPSRRTKDQVRQPHKHTMTKSQIEIPNCCAQLTFI